jgi:flagellar biosynthesis/type III secretory pathway chaperone
MKPQSNNQHSTTTEDTRGLEKAAILQMPSSATGASNIDVLCLILEKEYQIHDHLCAAAQVMNTALKEGKPAVVQESSFQYDEMVVQLEACEEERLSIGDRLAQELKCAHRHASITQLAAMLPPKDGERLCMVRNKLKQKIKDLATINMSNQILLEEGIYAISKIFDIIRNNMNTKLAGYQPHGAKARPDRKSVV